MSRRTIVAVVGLASLMIGVASYGAVSAGSIGTRAGSPAKPGVAQAYAKLPMSFAPDPAGGFVAHGKGYSLSLSPTASVLGLSKGDGSGTALRMNLLGADAAARPLTDQPLPGTVNYLFGNDPAAWHTNLPTFGRIAYAGVYPGIDVAYHGDQGQMEYDFTVAPGADAGSIRLGFDGARSLRLDNGELVISSAGGDVRHHAPVVHQDVDGSQVPVDGRFVLRGDNTVGFDLGAYDHAKPVVIDPTLAYSTYLGGGGVDYGNGIAVDASGNAYVAGWTWRDAFPTTSGSVQPSRPSANAAFVSKMNAAGNALVYSTYLGGNQYSGSLTVQYARRVALDSAGDAYVLGGTTTVDYPTTPNAFQTTAPDAGNNAGDIFLTELNPSGSGLVYSTYLGGTAADGPADIAVDALGNAYVTGTTASADFPVTAGSLRTTPIGGSDAFVTKVNPAGSALVYSTFLGGSADDSAGGMALDAGGRVYVAGETRSADLPATGAGMQPSPGGALDGFLARLNPTGSGLDFDTYLGGSGDDSARAVALDGSGNGYVTGYTTSADFPVSPGAFQSTLKGGEDAFVTKVAADGSTLGYSTLVGGTDVDEAQAIAVDAQGRAFIGGATVSVDLPLANPIQRKKCCANITPTNLQSDAFVTTLNATGSALVFSTYLGGSDNDEVLSMQVDNAGNVYLTGMTRSPRHAYPGDYTGKKGEWWPTTHGAFQESPPSNSNGPENAFITKIAGI